MRALLLLPVLLALTGLGCEGRPKSVLDLHTRKAPPRFPDDRAPLPEPPVHDAGSLAGRQDAGPTPAPSDAGSAEPSAEAAPAAPLATALRDLQAGDALTYALTLQPSPGTDDFKAFTVQATFRVWEVQDGELKVAVRLEPDRRAPPAIAFEGWLLLTGPLLDDLAVDRDALTCTADGRRCTLKSRQVEGRTIVLAPARRELALGGFVVLHQQRFPSGRGRRIGLVSAGEPRDRSRALDLVEGENVRDRVTPLTWAWRRIASLAPPPNLPDPDHVDLTGALTASARDSLLNARAASMAACRKQFPLAVGRPDGSFILKVTLGADGKLSDSSLKVTGDVSRYHPFVRCIQDELQVRVAVPRATKGSAPRTVDLLIPLPE